MGWKSVVCKRWMVTVATFAAWIAVIPLIYRAVLNGFHSLKGSSVMKA